MGRFNRAELADRSGVSGDYIDKLVELGILTAEPADAPFSVADVRRVRFARALEVGGLPLEGIGTAIRDGDLSFAFFDHPSFERFGGMVAATFRDLSTETGVSLDLLRTIRESTGFARPGADDPVREDELDLVALVQAGSAVGVDPLATERLIRVWGESVRRIAEAEADWYHTQVVVPLLRSGMSAAQTLSVGTETAAAAAQLLDRALVALYHMQSEHTWLTNIVEAVEATLEGSGLHSTVHHPPAMCFLDLSGYTRLTEERGDQAAAEMAATLGQFVQRGAHRHGGRPVKWLGDGVMIHFKDPGSAVISALEMVEGLPATGLPPAHVGIAAGPVIFQDGDYFGRTVNSAARIAAHAGAGEVLVSDDVRLATSDSSVEFVEIGPVELKGISLPLRLHRARCHS